MLVRHQTNIHCKGFALKALGCATVSVYWNVVYCIKQIHKTGTVHVFFFCMSRNVFHNQIVCVIQTLIMCQNNVFIILTFAWNIFFFTLFPPLFYTFLIPKRLKHTQNTEKPQSLQTGMCLIFILADMLDERLCIMIKNCFLRKKIIVFCLSKQFIYNLTLMGVYYFSSLNFLSF